MSDPIRMDHLPFNHTTFNMYLSKHRLMASRCANCGALFLPPRPLCSQCYSTSMTWVELSGEGVLAGFTTISVGLPVMIAEGYNRESPYCCGIVRLAEGPAISGQLLDMDCAQPETIQVGMPLRAAYLERGEGENRRVFLAFERT